MNETLIPDALPADSPYVLVLVTDADGNVDFEVQTQDEWHTVL